MIETRESMYISVKSQGREFNNKVVEFEDQLAKYKASDLSNQEKLKNINRTLSQLHTSIEAVKVEGLKT